MSSFAEKLKKAVSISRPIFWLGPPAAYAVGLALGGTMRGPFETWEMLLLAFPLSFLLYGINDIYDFESDKKNPRKGGLWGVRLEEKDIPWVKKTAFLFAAAMFVTGFSTLNPLHMLFTVLGLSIVYFYSAPPVRLKSIPVIDSLANGGYLYICFGLGCSLSGSTLFLHPYVVLGALCVSAGHALGTIMDYDSDKSMGERTFATVLGIRATALFAFVIFAISLLVFLNSGYHSFIGLVAGSFATLLSAFVLLSPKPENAKLAFKALIAFGLVVAYFYLLKYVVFGQWFGDFSEEELSQVRILWGG
ncbi:UbiA family prenyltransferase [Candidatus Micrarchaeota archaeon]|nr:UbiA family prenyltransferase [Candidatus Micrarchaeota archaeon]